MTPQPHKSRAYWTNPSVLALAGTEDPVAAILAKASATILEAIQNGLEGPPFDPARLAHFMGIAVNPREDVVDARIAVGKRNSLQIEYNPNRTNSRVRFSIAHELGHALFPDCAMEVRHRLTRNEQSDDDSQLEMLCNLAAAEFLMPAAHFAELGTNQLTLDHVLELRRQFDVSCEAVLLKLARLTAEPCAAFAASFDHNQQPHIDYFVPSRSWPVRLPNGSALPNDSLLTHCSAIGHTVKGREVWPQLKGTLVDVQAVGIPSFSGGSLPRTVGLVLPITDRSISPPLLQTVQGDATMPHGSGARLLVHVVNDKSPLWGAGFGLAVRKRWPEVQASFVEWATGGRGHLRLGNSHVRKIDFGLSIVHMVAQHGFGSSVEARLRYGPLRTCLEYVAKMACETQATVHLPRIGTGHAGGDWNIIRQLIDETLCSRGIAVTVYEFGNISGSRSPQQPHLFLS